MGRRCSVCTHEECHLINVALVSREPYRHIATRFDVSTGALRRHSSEHIPKLLVRASEALEISEADALLAKVEELRLEAMGVLDAAKVENDHRVVLAAIDRASRQLELLARLLGELDERPQVNVLISPQVQAVIIQALAPFPEARHAVADALAELEETRAK